MDALKTYLTPKLLTILALGFFSGLPLALTGSTLSTWLSDEGISIALIGIATIVATPYALKFLWSPLVDNVPLPFFTARFGRRRGWLVCVQLLLAIVILMMSVSNPAENMMMTLIAAVFLAYLSATQDIVIDALRTELLDPSELGQGSVMTTLGYRVGMLVSGAGCLYLADIYSWKVAYLAMAGLAVLGMWVTLMLKEPPDVRQKHIAPVGESFKALWRRRIEQTVITPFTDFMHRKGWLLILVFIATYKLGDAFLGNLTNPFLREIGFSKTQIANVVKLYGFAATIAGSFLGAWIVNRYGLVRPLLIGGFFHAVTNLMFLLQAKVGSDPTLIWFLPLGDSGWLISTSKGMLVLTLGITLENFTGGISSAILVVFISSLCNRQFTATQYALLSSLAVLGRTTLATSAGAIVANVGWEWFFIFSVLLALPSLILLYYIQKYMEKEDLSVRRKTTILPES